MSHTFHTIYFFIAVTEEFGQTFMRSSWKQRGNQFMELLSKCAFICRPNSKTHRASIHIIKP